jgi:hypothetical protein
VKRSSQSKSGKQWYRHKSRGDLGFLTVENGTTYVEVDRGADVVLRPFSPADWIPEDDLRLMTEMQVAQICFAADSELNKVLRWEPQSLGKSWLDMKPEEKRRWRDRGPDGETRRRLFNAIMATLIDLTRDRP